MCIRDSRLRALAAETGMDVLDVNAQPPFGPYSPFEGPAKDANNAAAAEAMAAADTDPDSESRAESGAASGRISPTSADSVQPAMPALSASSILAQSRSLIVDLLQVCGWSRESAVAVLKPTSATPAYPPEVRNRFFDDESDNHER